MFKQSSLCHEPHIEMYHLYWHGVCQENHIYLYLNALLINVSSSLCRFLLEVVLLPSNYYLNIKGEGVAPSKGKEPNTGLTYTCEMPLPNWVPAICLTTEFAPGCIWVFWGQHLFKKRSILKTDLLPRWWIKNSVPRQLDLTASHLWK